MIFFRFSETVNLSCSLSSFVYGPMCLPPCPTQWPTPVLHSRTSVSPSLIGRLFLETSDAESVYVTRFVDRGYKIDRKRSHIFSLSKPAPASPHRTLLTIKLNMNTFIAPVPSSCISPYSSLTIPRQLIQNHPVKAEIDSQCIQLNRRHQPGKGVHMGYLASCDTGKLDEELDHRGDSLLPAQLIKLWINVSDIFRLSVFCVTYRSA